VTSTMKNHRNEEKKTHPSRKKPSCKPIQDKQMDPKPRSAKSRICYTCRKKGHLGNDCPNGNTPQSNLVHYESHKLRNDKIDTCTMRMISSPQVSTRVIWVPNILWLTLKDPTSVGYQKVLAELVGWSSCIEVMTMKKELAIWYLVMRRTRKWTSLNQCNPSNLYLSCAVVPLSSLWELMNH
jgi:hypothetical protein